MSVGSDAKQFKSPLSKLVSFFRESRDRWKEKAQKVTQKWRKAHVQTPLACLLSPTLKMKARYMNLASLVAWANEMLKLLDHPRDDLGFDLARLQRVFGWLRDYAPAIAEWKAALDVIDTVNEYVRQHGYHHGAAARL